MSEYSYNTHQFQEEEGFPYIYGADAETYYQLMNEDDRAYIEEYEPDDIPEMDDEEEGERA